MRAFGAESSPGVADVVLPDWITTPTHRRAIISRRYYANSIGYPSESASGSKWHACFTSRCPGRRLSTWPTTAVSCPTALGALCGQLMVRPAWCCKYSVVMATELLQPWGQEIWVKRSPLTAQYLLYTIPHRSEAD